MELSEHLFRRESGRMVASLTRVFGVQNLELAEDVVQDAFCRALEVWRFRGIPENPAAWLMATAKNRAIDVLRRERTARTFAPELGRVLETEWTLSPTVEELLAPGAIKDDRLRMMFSCCHPRLQEDAQVALILHLLCGFSVDEIAGAFVSSRSAIEKRISRSKAVFTSTTRLFDLDEREAIPSRIAAVHRAVYLLFNEGYHGASPAKAIREELCQEAMRLAALLIENPLTATSATYALAALLCFNAARLPSRIDDAGDLNSLSNQDRSKWDRGLIDEGERFLESAAHGSELSEYHVEAAIASIHGCASSTESTDWHSIVSLYDTLLELRPTAVVALNRAIALSQLQTPERGLEEIRAIPDLDKLFRYPFYYAALGELELRCGRSERAQDHFEAALGLARNPMERRFLQKRVEASRTG